MAFIRKLLQDTRASYWFVPSVMMVVALLLAIGTEALDRHPNYLPFSLPNGVVTSNADAVRSLLAVIAQSVIAVTGVMFSMTIVAVSFASANFGPRLIGNFMRDKGTQFSLGILIATFVYALMILRSVHNIDDSGANFVPVFSVLVALGLTLASVVTMIFFIHHVPEMINLENLCHSLGCRLRDELIRLSKASTATTDKESVQNAWFEEANREASEGVTLLSTGYIQTVNLNQIKRLASKNDLYIDVLAMPGTFTHPRNLALRVWGQGALSTKLIGDLRACFATGVGKSESQNVLFLAEQLVEIIARALSPGVNDPYTACTCLNWLHASLQELAAIKAEDIDLSPSRVHTPTLTFTSLLEIAHGDSREYILSDNLVCAHAVKLLRGLAASLPKGPRRDSVDREIGALLGEN
ncbi:DUF2254 domain-containing protein [Falsihalocynthiibacter arcticus]|uniref:DUF2254 domain-containing protein n=1 Tax=Falsihalocynthiibacter arcticus TaxID=1579316 RepID=A0A126V1E1_9RHOB|nr:DUF2254 domain-containing protein [Falsihalocynthiibacter arcticus]AML52124.1 hypothetical protein RC74_13315 [Falsihalocynthiibacter arcticus]